MNRQKTKEILKHQKSFLLDLFFNILSQQISVYLIHFRLKFNQIKVFSLSSSYFLSRKENLKRKKWRNWRSNFFISSSLNFSCSFIGLSNLLNWDWELRFVPLISWFSFNLLICSKSSITSPSRTCLLHSLKSHSHLVHPSFYPSPWALPCWNEIIQTLNCLLLMVGDDCFIWNGKNLKNN